MNEFVRDRLVSERDNGLSNIYPRAGGEIEGYPIFNYSTLDLADAIRRTEVRRVSFNYDPYELARLIQESNEYDFLLIGIPANITSVEWKDTYRDQFGMAEGSYIIAILACAQAVTV